MTSTYTEDYKVCKKYESFSKTQLINLCYDLAESTELFIDGETYKKDLSKTTKSKLVVLLRRLELRADFMHRNSLMGVV